MHNIVTIAKAIKDSSGPGVQVVIGRSIDEDAGADRTILVIDGGYSLLVTVDGLNKP